MNTNENKNSCCGSNCAPNKSIGCTVSQCSHHCGSENYCSLSKIQVVTHEENPTVVQCTDCSSFEPKQ